MLREKENFFKMFCILASLVLFLSSVGYVLIKYRVNYLWNDEVLAKMQPSWDAMDTIERDLINGSLFLKGCRKDFIFQEIDNGFQIQTVESRNQSMEVLQNVPEYSDRALSVYLGSGIRTGDELILCNSKEERKIQLQVIRNNPKWNYHFLIFPDPIVLDKEVPHNLIKFKTVTYRFEKSAEGEILFRSEGKEEKTVLEGILSHEIIYSFEDAGESYFQVDLKLQETFPDGTPMEVKRRVPITTFERLPKELEGKAL